MKYVVVSLNISIEKNFEYRVLEELENQSLLGCLVLVPFGKLEKEAIVIEEKSTPSIEEKKIKSIKKNLGYFISPKLLRLAHWLSDYYCSSLFHSLQLIIPSSLKKSIEKKNTRDYLIILNKNINLEELNIKYKKSKAKLKILHFFSNSNSEEKRTDLMKICQVSSNVINELIKENILLKKFFEKEINFFNNKHSFLPPDKLTNEQKVAVDKIDSSIEKYEFNCFLLHGVTGSGKTEVFLQTIKTCIKNNKQVIFLVPEISLAPQSIHRLSNRFKNQVAVIHSKLTEKQRNQQWLKIKNNKVKIVIGARSALFVPFDNIGLIIVDEEHEGSYKQEQKEPRYNARDVAVMRAYIEKAVIILASATPSFESFFNAEMKKYHYLVMKDRIAKKEMPSIDIIDMKKEALREEQVQVFSKELLEEIRETLNHNLQVIIFLNKRGYSPKVQCSQCSWVCECSGCAKPYIFHKQKNYISCNLCEIIKPAPSQCPQCQSLELNEPGLGTEKIDNQLKKIFPYAKIARMDSDNMKTNNNYREVLDSFQQKKIDILVGTQMLAKGLDFPNVVLVGVIYADYSLNYPNFRANEKTFQLLTQVSGRSGRGGKRGKVLIQSYQVSHPVFSYVKDNDYINFYKEEMLGRKLLKLPPYYQQINIKFIGEDENHKKFTQLRDYLSKKLDMDGIKITKVLPCPQFKIKNLYYFEFNIFMEKTLNYKNYIKKSIKLLKLQKKERIIINVSPV